MTQAVRKQVLVLDDSPIVLELVGEALEAAGMDFLAAPDLAAFEEALKRQPDLLVIDVNMPEAYGDDVGAVLRDVRGVKVPILLFSSLPESQLAVRAAEGRFDGYVSKDAGIAALVQRARELLEEGPAQVRALKR